MRKLLGFLLILPVGVSVHLSAQDLVLEEVVVTAAKVEASIQDTPIAVTAFSQEALDSQLINDASAMQFSVPNSKIGNIIGRGGSKV